VHNDTAAKTVEILAIWHMRFDRAPLLQAEAGQYNGVLKTVSDMELAAVIEVEVA
jgi:hypothetical protein